jgi:hypothetical protein
LFRKATVIADKFTRALVISTRQESGKVEGALAAFVLVNADGWALTAAHVFQLQATFDAHQIERADHARKVATINANTHFNAQRKQREIRHLKANPAWLTHISHWWGAPGVTAVPIFISPMADLALVKLNGHPMDGVVFPTFGNPAAHIGPGTFLCKLGYPFNAVDVSWDDIAKQFHLGNKSWPLFPLEGMMTRTIHIADPAGNPVAKFIETSTPGLRGQSGGPVFDADGTVWGIQSRTNHYDLGFAPPVKEGGRTVIEHQFLNTSWSADVEEIQKLAAANGVNIAIAP